MTLTPTNYGNNPFQPGIVQDAFIPDQLIAGDMKVVTKSVTITGGAALKRGSVLGQVSVGAVGAATITGTGNGTITAATAGARAKVGTYTVRMKGATTFDVINPNGVQIAEGFALGAYTDAEIAFTITAGGTAFVAGDTIAIPVAAGSGAYKLATAAATDGSQNPVAILIDDADASGGDVIGGIYQTGEFNGNAVTLGAGITLAAATAALEAQNIYLKTPLSAADPT